MPITLGNSTPYFWVVIEEEEDAEPCHPSPILFSAKTWCYNGHFLTQKYGVPSGGF